MSQQDNFSSGFLWGAVLGSIAGGVVGAMLATRSGETEESEEINDGQPIEAPEPNRVTSRRSLRLTTAPEQPMELARQSLEDKIASLNDAIDEVRQQLNQVSTGGNSLEEKLRQRSVSSMGNSEDDRSHQARSLEENS